MSLLVLQHAKSETPGVLGSILQSYGHPLRVIHLYAGQSLPPDFDDVDGVLSLGGPMNVEDAAAHPWITGEIELLKQAHARQIPILGICLGAQLIATALGGKVAAMAAGPEVGYQPIKVSFFGITDPMYAGIKANHNVFHLHGQEVVTPPPGATVMAGSKACKVQSFKVGLTTYGFQYHFEWNDADLKIVATDELVTKAGSSAQAIREAGQHAYAEYRRLGDRLCGNIAGFLFPANQRV